MSSPRGSVGERLLPLIRQRVPFDDVTQLKSRFADPWGTGCSEGSCELRERTMPSETRLKNRLHATELT